MCVLEKLNFKISRRSMPPDPPSVLAPPVLDPLSAESTRFDVSKNVNLLYVILV